VRRLPSPAPLNVARAKERCALAAVRRGMAPDSVGVILRPDEDPPQPGDVERQRRPRPEGGRGGLGAPGR
jgi:hypothetical protein